MRKISFYPKFAISNLLRNRTTYFPYLLACITSIITFYTLLSINMNPALGQLRGAQIVESFVFIGTIIVAIFCTILLFYTNSFLIKRRKKELGLYSILGMEKRNIAVTMFLETVFIAAIALIFGLAGGTLISRLIFLLLLRLVHLPTTIDMPISFQAMSITAAFFLLVFLLTLLSNLRQVRLANPINLLHGANHGEKEPKASWFITLLGILCLGGGYYIAVWVQSPVDAIILFLLAAFLVIIGTYCLFTSGSIALLKLLRRNKKYYYTPKHFISVSGLIYRMKQNAAGLASICILSCMVLVTVSATVCLYLGSEDTLKVRYPYDYSVNITPVASTEATSTDGDAATMLSGAQALAAQNNLTLENVKDYVWFTFTAVTTAQGYEPTDIWDANNEMVQFQLLTLDGYNNIENTQETLGEGQALLFGVGTSYTGETLTVGNSTFSVRNLETFDGHFNGEAGTLKTFVLILPNDESLYGFIQNLPEELRQTQETNYGVRRTLSFDLAGEESGKEAFFAGYTALLQETPTQNNVYFESRDDGRESWYMINGGFLFLGIYFGVLFLLAATMIIYYKQISEGYDDRERYDIMQKVGMSAKEVRGTINSQIRTVFFLPLIIAVIHISFAFFPISKAMVIFSITNPIPLLISCLVTVLCYTVLYTLLYRRTARAYYRIVRRQA